VAAPLSHALAATMDRWRRALAPFAEHVAHTFAALVATDYRATTPLTGRRHADSQERVRSRQAKSRSTRLRMEAFPQGSTLQPELPLGRTCVDCGKPLARSRHVRCPDCWEAQPGQDAETRQRRGRAIADARAKLEAWKVDPDVIPPDEDFEPIRSVLSTVKLREIMDACGVAKSTASAIRAGRLVPARRHWTALMRLVHDRSPTASQSTSETMSTPHGLPAAD
jgi:hypothetical protein